MQYLHDEQYYIDHYDRHRYLRHTIQVRRLEYF